MAPDPGGRGPGHPQILSPRGALVYRTPPTSKLWREHAKGAGHERWLPIFEEEKKGGFLSLFALQGSLSRRARPAKPPNPPAALPACMPPRDGSPEARA